MNCLLRCWRGLGVATYGGRNRNRPDSRVGIADTLSKSQIDTFSENKVVKTSEHRITEPQSKLNDGSKPKLIKYEDKNLGNYERIYPVPDKSSS